MREPDTPDETFGLTDSEVYLCRDELTEECPAPAEMAAEMDLEAGDVFEDAHGLGWVVTDINHVSHTGGLLLDDPDATTREELHENGIHTALIDYYAAWRRGEITVRDHRPDWPPDEEVMVSA